MYVPFPFSPRISSHTRTRSKRAPFAVVLALTALATLGGCSAIPYEYDATDPDPIEPVNRIMYGITDLADRIMLEPAADLYLLATPDPIQEGVSNFFDNLGYPDTIINDFLQGKTEQGLSDLGRFAVNSTVGLLGILDVATLMGLEAHNEDLGQTLGVWGAGEGPYLFVPLLGPHHLRDVGNIPMSIFTNPLYYAQSGITSPLIALSIIEQRARLKSASRIRDEAALDPYIFTREAYRQNRNYEIYDGNPPPLKMDLELDLDVDRELEAELNGKG